MSKLERTITIILLAESDGFLSVDHQMEQLSLNEMSSTTAARRHLETIAERYKFSVNYTDFPVVSILSINQKEKKHCI